MSIYARRNFVIANFGPNVLLTQPLTNGQVLVYNAQLGSFINQPGSELFTASNLGTGIPVFAEKQGSDFEFNSLIAGPNVQLANVDGNIQISATGSTTSSSILVVNNIADRNALTVPDGTLVFVKDTGTGTMEYAFYMWSATASAWVTLGTQESANSDANTFTYTISAGSATKIPLGYISSGHRAVDVSVSVLLPFNGISPTLTIGDDTNGAASLMTANDNDLTNEGEYNSSANFVYSGSLDTLINAYFNSGSSTVGQAIIIVSYV
jgi:hypothetical protein